MFTSIYDAAYSAFVTLKIDQRYRFDHVTCSFMYLKDIILYGHVIYIQLVTAIFFATKRSMCLLFIYIKFSI